MGGFLRLGQWEQTHLIVGMPMLRNRYERSAITRTSWILQRLAVGDREYALPGCRWPRIGDQRVRRIADMRQNLVDHRFDAAGCQNIIEIGLLEV